MSLDISKVRRALPQYRIEYHDSIPSTQPLAMKLAEAGAASGTAVVAGEQTAEGLLSSVQSDYESQIGN